MLRGSICQSCSDMLASLPCFFHLIDLFPSYSNFSQRPSFYFFLFYPVLGPSRAPIFLERQRKIEGLFDLLKPTKNQVRGVRRAKPKLGKLGTSYVVTVRLSNLLVRAMFECSNQQKLFQTRIIRAESYLENLKPKPKNQLWRQFQKFQNYFEIWVETR